MSSFDRFRNGTLYLTVKAGPLGEYERAVNLADLPIFSERYVDEIENPSPFGLGAVPAEVSITLGRRALRGSVIREAAKRLADDLIEAIEKAEGWKVPGQDDKATKPVKPGVTFPPLDQRTRAEHVQWCKMRAREYLDRGDLRNAVASMTSDMRKHPATREIMSVMAMIGMSYVMAGDGPEVERWIEGFAE